MGEKYDHKKIEQAWQKRWEETGAFRAEEKSVKPKQYLLIEFPYPSGDGLHVGHIRSWTALDIVARKRRAQGESVLYPIGWDAFGLPAENYAIKTGIHPTLVTKQNTDNFRRQIKSLGISFDWSREVNTTDPGYYRWTQWIFLQLFKKGLAYKQKTLINWCPKDKIGLANEEVVDGACERCGTSVEKREKEQWMLAITKYAQRLYDDLDTVNYIEAAKAGQRNWIGPSQGAELEFALAGSERKIKVFTTRPDTLFGATYVVLAPEHPLTVELAEQSENKEEVVRYVTAAKNKSDIERSAEGKEKTGVLLQGVRAINPANKEEVPVYVADYVLGGYGTGAIMAVPAHDARDLEFAKKYDIAVIKVVQPKILGSLKKPGEKVAALRVSKDESLIPEPYLDTGVLINSGPFTGINSEEAKKEITEAAGGTMVTTYKLRDWVFSRQRYWGEPIPMIQCEKDGWVPVPEEQLPITLPNVEKYQPTETGEAPLANMHDWVNTACPKCGGAAKRETDVMPNWAGSSWYYLRYTDPENATAFASSEALCHWTPVDWYNGGMEHTTLHLLYSRFWHKFLFDIDAVPTSEPYMKRTSHGLILAEGGEKMSKSKGNTVSPDELVERFGADVLRVYEMFIGPFDQPVAWSTAGMAGAERFLDRVWRLGELIGASTHTDIPKPLETLLHQTIKKVGDDIEALKLNTAVSALMILLNALERNSAREAYEIFLQLLAPFAPHMTHELWEKLGEKGLISQASWPTYEPAKLLADSVTIAIQVNGKVRATIELPVDMPKEEVFATARAQGGVAKWLTGKEEKKAIYVPGKIISFLTS